jgi:hypothetical protein
MITAFNTLTDFFLTVQPALLIKHTRLATGNKIGVASLFCLSIMYDNHITFHTEHETDRP